MAVTVPEKLNRDKRISKHKGQKMWMDGPILCRSKESLREGRDMEGTEGRERKEETLLVGPRLKQGEISLGKRTVVCFTAAL